MFVLAIMKPAFGFTNVNTVTILSMCSALIVHNNPEEFEILLDCYERLKQSL